MALHYFIDGLTLGVFEETKEMIILASTLVIHKIPCAYSVGVSFVAKNQPLCDKKTLIFLAIFIFSSPLGIMTGALVGQTKGMGTVIVQSLSGGVFIYIACCDFIVHEFQNSNDINEKDDR